MCLRSFDEENKGSSSNKNDKEKMTSGNSVLSKMTSGRKDSCGKNPEQNNQESEKTKSKDTTCMRQKKTTTMTAQGKTKT